MSAKNIDTPLQSDKEITPSINKTIELECFLPYKINQVALAISESLGSVYLREANVTRDEWRVLAHIAEHLKISPKKIMEVGVLDQVTVSRTLSKLESRNLVEKTPNKEDRRAYFVTLTDQGISLYNKIVPIAMEWEDQLLCTLNNSEYRDLIKTLEKLRRHIKRGQKPTEIN